MWPGVAPASPCRLPPGHPALDSFLVDYLATPEDRRTAIASSFAATLELVREGTLELRQQEVFAPIYLRGRPKPIGAVEVAS